MSSNRPDLSDTSLRTVLRRLAAEAERLARDGERLHACAAALAESSRDPAAMREVQLIDSMVQHLAGLAAFTEALADAADPDVRLDLRRASEGLTLAGLAARLNGEPPHVSLEPQARPAGSVELL